MNFYLFVGNVDRGPYAESELRDMLAHRELDDSTLACREGAEEWEAIGSILDVPVAQDGSKDEPQAGAPAAKSDYLSAYLSAQSGSVALENPGESRLLRNFRASAEPGSSRHSSSTRPFSNTFLPSNR